MSVWIWMALVVFLIIFSGFFAAAEIGMMSINRYRLRHLVKLKQHRALMVQEQLNQPERLLSSVLIGNTLGNLFASMAMTFIGESLYREAGIAIAEIILTILLLVFAEMTPKTWAARFPEKVSFHLVYPLRVIQYIFAPLTWLTTFFSHRLLKLLGVSSYPGVTEQLSYDELRAVMHATDALIPKEHLHMMIQLLDLQRAEVEDVMIPKNEIIGIDITSPWTDIVEQLETLPHTRIPLYQKHIENLVAVIHVRKVLQLLLDEELDLEHLLKAAEKPIYIPAGTTLNKQILQFQSKKSRSGFVVNEYGDLLGLVTLEDILEEVVGNFTTDVTELSRDVISQENDEYLVDASIQLKQLSRIMECDFPQIGPRTLSGLIIEHLGYIPVADSCLSLLDFHITILRVSDQIIRSVRMKKVIQETGD